MTLDAMDWVWTRARARGNARIVLLAIADACTDDTATVRMGTAEVMRRLGVPTKSTALAAVAAALKTGELVIDQPAAGSRAARYQLPGAVGHMRGSGLNARPQTEGSGFQTTSDLRSESQTATASVRGLNLRPQRDQGADGLWSESQTACGLKSGPHHSPSEGVSEGVVDAREPERRTAVVPEFARPLVDRITASGVIVKWSLGDGEWFGLDHLIQRSGVDMLAAEAVKVAGRTSVSHARYFLKAWRDLPPAPAAGTAPVAPQPAGPNVVPFDATAPRRSRAQRTADELALILAREAQQ